MSIYVLDSSAIINYLNRYYAPGLQLYTTNSVLIEVKSLLSQLRLEYLLSRGELRVRDPSKDAINKVKEIAQYTGDLFKLSRTDIDVIALALDLRKLGFKVIIVTDDYAIMNLASKLSIPFKSALMSPISEYRERILMCPTCGYRVRLSSQNESIPSSCPRCGSDLRFFVKRRRRLNN